MKNTVSVSDNLKINGVKISTLVKGVPSFGSGIVYLTPHSCKYNYVLTAKHIFQEDSKSNFNTEQVFHIDISYSEKGVFTRLQHVKKTNVKNSLIVFDDDFAIIVIDKFKQIAFQPIFVSDDFDTKDLNFFSWATFTANSSELHKFDFERNDTEMKRFKLKGNNNHFYLPGISGAGMINNEKTTLYGIICKYPNAEFQNETVDCALINFQEINVRLQELGRVPLDTKSSGNKREIKKQVVDINQALINGVALNLDLARKRLQTDIQDDWYHDPLKYIDLLSTNFLFEQFEKYFGNNIYKARMAEKFYVPKKKYTLREALVSPFIDRIIYMATVGVLAEKLDDSMLPNVYSARYNRVAPNKLIINGVEQWKKMKYKLAEYAMMKTDTGKYRYGCVIEIDLLNFYDNIKKSLLCDKIDRVCETSNEKKASEILRDILNKISVKELGLPQNSDASSLLASFYLNQVDIFMQHNAPAYFRFMDDIRIFCEDKYEARQILKIFEFELRRCHLSVNSQKTEIYTLVEEEKKSTKPDEKIREDYEKLFDIEINKIATLRKSENFVHRNDAFHLCVEILERSLEEEDINSSEDSSRKLNFALNTIAFLGQKDMNLFAWEHSFTKFFKLTINNLKDKPWITTQVCKVLNLVPSEVINREYLNTLKEIVLKHKYNTYSFQTYQIWLLLAKHKCNSADLKTYAIGQIEKNDETNRPVIASMIIYMCSVDHGYRRVILRKFGEGFAHGYFQNRIALVSLRNFPPEIIDESNISKTLSTAHKFTHHFKDKDLVFVQGFDETDEDSDEDLEQLYSI